MNILKHDKKRKMAAKKRLKRVPGMGFEPTTFTRPCPHIGGHNLQIMSIALYVEAGALTRLSYPGDLQVELWMAQV